MKCLISEFVATFVLVFFGTGAIVINDIHQGVISHLGIGMVFGMAVMAMIMTFGKVSGAQMNPAVTLALAVAKKIPWRHVAPYVAAQVLGALAASWTLAFLFPDAQTLGETLPKGSVLQSFILELILTFMLMLVVLRMTADENASLLAVALVIGLVVSIEAIVAGPICGASMNPARSLAPALVSGNTQHLWLYLVATSLGALLAVPVAQIFNRDKV